MSYTLADEQVDAVKARYSDDEEVQKLAVWYTVSKKILERALFEFGSELRSDIERLLGEQPILPRG